MSSIRIGFYVLLGLGVATSASAAPVDPVPEYTPPPLRMLAVPSPCPGPNCGQVIFEGGQAAQGLRVVYLAFDGVTLYPSSSNDDARTNTSAIVNSNPEVIAPFSTSQMGSTGGLSRSQIISQVVSDMYALHSDFNVEFVTTRPSSGVYSMVVFGGSCPSVVGESGCAGIALLDCGDYLPANITFAFPPGLRVGDLAVTAAQEAAHAFGLGHTNDPYDVMYPALQAYIPDQFTNAQHSIPDGSGCGGATSQNSYQMMLGTIGPRGQDTTNPTVNITEPLPGSVVGGGTLVRATASDNIAVDHVDLEIDGALVKTVNNPPYEWALSATIAPGEHLLTVRAYDVNGNNGYQRITVLVPTGDEPDCATNGDCATGYMCSGQICVPEVAGSLGASCASNDECLTSLCGTLGDESRCTQQCSDTSPCPAGFSCISGEACWPDNPPDDGDGEGGICSASQRPDRSGLLGLALLALLVGFSLRRRPIR